MWLRIVKICVSSYINGVEMQKLPTFEIEMTLFFKVCSLLELLEWVFVLSGFKVYSLGALGCKHVLDSYITQKMFFFCFFHFTHKYI